MKWVLERSLRQDTDLIFRVGLGQTKMNGTESLSSRSRSCESQRTGGGVGTVGKIAHARARTHSHVHTLYTLLFAGKSALRGSER